MKKLIDKSDRGIYLYPEKDTVEVFTNYVKLPQRTRKPPLSNVIAYHNKLFLFRRKVTITSMFIDLLMEAMLSIHRDVNMVNNDDYKKLFDVSRRLRVEKSPEKRKTYNDILFGLGFVKNILNIKTWPTEIKNSESPVYRTMNVNVELKHDEYVDFDNNRLKARQIYENDSGVRYHMDQLLKKREAEMVKKRKENKIVFFLKKTLDTNSTDLIKLGLTTEIIRVFSDNFEEYVYKPFVESPFTDLVDFADPFRGNGRGEIIFWEPFNNILESVAKVLKPIVDEIDRETKLHKNIEYDHFRRGFTMVGEKDYKDHKNRWGEMSKKKYNDEKYELHKYILTERYKNDVLGVLQKEGMGTTKTIWVFYYYVLDMLKKQLEYLESDIYVEQVYGRDLIRALENEKTQMNTLLETEKIEESLIDDDDDGLIVGGLKIESSPPIITSTFDDDDDDDDDDDLKKLMESENNFSLTSPLPTPTLDDLLGGNPTTPGPYTEMIIEGIRTDEILMLSSNLIGLTPDQLAKEMYVILSVNRIGEGVSDVKKLMTRMNEIIGVFKRYEMFPLEYKHYENIKKILVYMKAFDSKRGKRGVKHKIKQEDYETLENYKQRIHPMLWEFVKEYVQHSVRVDALKKIKNDSPDLVFKGMMSEKRRKETSKRKRKKFRKKWMKPVKGERDKKVLEKRLDDYRIERRELNEAEMEKEEDELNLEEELLKYTDVVYDNVQQTIDLEDIEDEINAYSKEKEEEEAKKQKLLQSEALQLKNLNTVPPNPNYIMAPDLYSFWGENYDGPSQGMYDYSDPRFNLSKHKENTPRPNRILVTPGIPDYDRGEGEKKKRERIETDDEDDEDDEEEGDDDFVEEISFDEEGKMVVTYREKTEQEKREKRKRSKEQEEVFEEEKEMEQKRRRFIQLAMVGNRLMLVKMVRLGLLRKSDFDFLKK